MARETVTMTMRAYPHTPTCMMLPVDEVAAGLTGIQPPGPPANQLQSYRPCFVLKTAGIAPPFQVPKIVAKPLAS
jgi:hypothetical protein